MDHLVLPAHSQQSKGSVKRNNGYLDTPLLPLRSVVDLTELQAQSGACAARVAWPLYLRRPRDEVMESLAVERADLPDPLPEVDPRLEVRTSRDGFARVACDDYPLSPSYAIRRVS